MRAPNRTAFFLAVPSSPSITATTTCSSSRAIRERSRAQSRLRHDGAGLALAKEIYAEALAHIDELCAPYATVIDIDPEKLPGKDEVAGWSAEQFTAALRHEPKCPEFNPHLRQLLHVAFKIAAKQGERYTKMLGDCEAAVSRNVTQNLYERHLKPLFL